MITHTIPSKRLASPKTLNHRATTLTRLSCLAAIALPLAFVVLWAWAQVAPPPPGASTEAGLAALLTGLQRGAVCMVLAGLTNFAGVVLGLAGAVVHPEQRGRRLAAGAALLNAAPYVLLLLATAVSLPWSP